MRIFIFILVISILIGCQAGSPSEIKLFEKDLFSLESGIFNVSLSPNNKALFVHGVNEAAVIDADNGKRLNYNLIPELNDAIWSPNGKDFLSFNSQGFYEFLSLNKEKRLLEEGLFPTAWSADGNKFYAYKGYRIYEIDVQTLEQKEITVDMAFLDKEKKVLFETSDGKKVILVNNDSLLVADKSLRIIREIKDIDYTEGINDNTIQLSPDGGL